MQFFDIKKKSCRNESFSGKFPTFITATKKIDDNNNNVSNFTKEIHK